TPPPSNLPLSLQKLGGLLFALLRINASDAANKTALTTRIPRRLNAVYRHLSLTLKEAGLKHLVAFIPFKPLNRRFRICYILINL
ncbi:hypothetical protein, partial [Erwinia amylovora]|uniref:hypothetical protein n=1 Tax=Erwinia amylovora TaxID=552 RepID=UPI0019657711